MTPGEPLDSGDLDALNELVQSAGYGLFATRIREEIESRRNDLERPIGEPETALARGVIAGLRLVLEIPGNLIFEITEDLKEAKKHGT